MKKLLVMLVLASLGVGTADEHEPVWNDFVNSKRIPFDSETEILQLKTNWEGEKGQMLDIQFYNGEKYSSWFLSFGQGALSGSWTIDPCMGSAYLKSTLFSGSEAEKLMGEKTWSFTKKENIMTVLLNGEEWKKIEPIDAEGTPTQCRNDEEFQNWAMKSTEVMFRANPSDDKEPTHYRVVAQKKEDENKDDGDKKDGDKEDYSGSSQVCQNGLVLMFTLFAGLRL